MEAGVSAARGPGPPGVRAGEGEGGAEHAVAE